MSVLEKKKKNSIFFIYFFPSFFLFFTCGTRPSSRWGIYNWTRQQTRQPDYKTVFARRRPYSPGETLHADMMVYTAIVINRRRRTTGVYVPQLHRRYAIPDTGPGYLRVSCGRCRCAGTDQTAWHPPPTPAAAAAATARRRFFTVRNWLFHYPSRACARAHTHKIYIIYSPSTISHRFSLHFHRTHTHTHLRYMRISITHTHTRLFGTYARIFFL